VPIVQGSFFNDSGKKRRFHMSGRTIASVAAGMALLAAILLAKSYRHAEAHTLVVTADYVQTAPQGLDDPIWRSAPAVQLLVEARDKTMEKYGTVTTRALYTDDTLFFLFKWNDPTQSVTKQSWQFDGRQWRHLKGNEDRLALLFEITRIQHFATRGCAVTCHSPADVPREKWQFATRSADEKGDLWHWKAARSAPYRYADDAWLTVAGNPTGSYRTSGRRKDTGTGGDIRNETADRTRPLFARNPSIAPSRPGFLLMEESAKITDYASFKAGDILPYRLPVKPSGSRFDVKAISRYIDGGWTVMLFRKLNTGHDDDVVFNPKKRYSFALAVFDDSGSEHSKATQPMSLLFRR
jgi:hypothetical protein